MPSKISFVRKPVIAFLILASVLTAGTLLIISSCSSRLMSREEASRWIAAYTPAQIDQDSEIRIEMTDMMKSMIDTTRSLVGTFDFSPGLKGSLHYSADARNIDFIPSESMEQGRRYKCRVDMSAITGVDTLADFAFDFYVVKREVRFEDIAVMIDPDDISRMCVSGRIEYNVDASDSITADSEFISCDCPGANVVMERKTLDCSREFKITGIERQAKDRRLTLSVNPASGFTGETYELTIPSAHEFKLLNGRRIEAPEPYINLEFSAPLSQQQELDGLITIDKIDDLRIECKGANVKLYYGHTGLTDLTLRVSDLVRNNKGDCLGEEIELHFSQELIPPAIKIPINGNILPDDRCLKLPFRAVNLAAVDVEVVKIFPSNVLSFLQENIISETSQLRRFGRLIYHRTVRLDKDKSLNLHQWQDFSIDLKDMFAKERGAIYNIRLTFRKAYSLYGKDTVEDFDEVTGISDDERAMWDETYPYIYRDAPDYSCSDFNWDEQNDPTKESYYMFEYDRMPEVNLVASDLGVLVKRGAGNDIKVVVTNLITASPSGGVRLTAYNYQLQKIAAGVTDANGVADLKPSSEPFVIAATDGKSTTYLTVRPGYELSTSNFDVSGVTIRGGIKGFVYGERGVWRPGDDIHLTLIIEDKEKRLPDSHPVVMELYNPTGQLYNRQIHAKGVDGFYTFTVSTDETVPTGLWKAKIKLGNETFEHPVRIETIKPNRLKINIRTPHRIRANEKVRIGLGAQWLTGPSAKGMDASLDMALYVDENPFEKFKDYTFKNPILSYTPTSRGLFDGRLDENGNIQRDCIIGGDVNSPGMLLANITARVTEPGGDASITTKSVQFSPFGVYVGINLGQKEFETDQELRFNIAVVNQDGARLKARELEYKIYRLDWNWWWEGSAEDMQRYVRSSSADIVAHGKVNAVNGHAVLPFKVEYPSYGKYLIHVRDIKGGHATGGVVAVDWPEWRGRSNKSAPAGSTELAFMLDKKQYEVGESAAVYLPACDSGRVLLSVENGTKVLKTMWVNLSADKETKFSLPVDKSMAPNFYVSATMLRPHRETDFETPIRLFGIQSAMVVNRQSVLHPVIDMPDELHPHRQFTIKVNERDSRPMTYTLAIVDEGLLDITNFKTPRPWGAMNQKEKAGVRTWDMYDDVIGAFGSNFRSVLSVGGDEALRKAAGKEKRFNPVVKFLGPFTTDGRPQKHNITLPDYVGSVRVMVVAAHDGCYGNSDQTVKVTAPLMLLPTLPRTLANSDTVSMPVNVFVMDQSIKEVSLRIDADGPVKITGDKTRCVSFSGSGEQLVNFGLVCDKTREGRARIIVTATGKGHVAKDTSFIDISNPMPVVTEIMEKILSGPGSSELSWTPLKSGTVTLQVARMPMPDFNGMTIFMENYPHLCTEQLSSKALFMLFGRRFLNAESRKKCESELPQIIKTVQSRQLDGGGYVYWPGQSDENEWVSSLAGMALFEAQRQGFGVDRVSLEKWMKYQQARARDYRYSADTDLMQAFRLYTLAVAGAPSVSAMNRLRESKKLTRSAAYSLASAYAEAGRRDVALKLIERAEKAQTANSDDIFYSPTRDSAMALEAYTLCDLQHKAMQTARKIAAVSGAMYVTQDIALMSIAFSRLAESTPEGPMSLRVTERDKTPISVIDNGCIRNLVLDPYGGSVKVENMQSKGMLELSLLTSYRPAADKTVVPCTRGVKIMVNYVDMFGKPIDISHMRQNTDFKVIIRVTNLSDDVENMALSYGIPSGWEIWNDRLYGYNATGLDNRDIRDSASNYYFGLKRGCSKTFEIKLRAAYAGKFLLPAVVCEDMYNPACRAMTSTRRVSVNP